jgi:hypothetical protein
MGKEARQAASDLNFAKAFALSEQIKGVAGWDEVDGLRAQVADVDALVGAYVQRQQQAAAAAAWQAQVRAQQVAVAQARAEYARAQAALRPSSAGGRGSSSLKERAATLRDRAIQNKCRLCGQNFTESREEHEAYCTGSRN